MSELWIVECKQKQGRDAVLEVRQCHPDSGELFASAGFVLRLLGDNGDACASLLEAFGEDWYEDEWLTANAPKFIEKVAFELGRASIDQAAMEALQANDEDLGYAAVGALGTYRVTFTDAKWIEALEEGASWESAAYSNARPYAGRVIAASGDTIAIELRQGTADVATFPDDPAFVARVLFAGPLDTADAAPDFAELLDLAFVRARAPELLSASKVTVKRPPVTLQTLAKAKRLFDPEREDVGLALYEITLGDEAAGALADVEVDSTFDVDARFTSLDAAKEVRVEG